ncbi:unnamed protein product [Pedinophyceae sp. YPF-701]|nr:unnamed protein product [Pedinophyceae sp. YPF-701]
MSDQEHAAVQAGDDEPREQEGGAGSPEAGAAAGQQGAGAEHAGAKGAGGDLDGAGASQAVLSYKAKYANTSPKMRRQRGSPMTEKYKAKVSALFEDRADDQGCVPLTAVPEMLSQLEVDAGDESEWKDLASSVASNGETISEAEFLALIGYLGPGAQTQRSAAARRSYLETGVLTADPAVLQFMRTLREHQSRCEDEGKYAEAKAARARLLQLRQQEVERLTAEMAKRHEDEQREAEEAFREEKKALDEAWAVRVESCAANVAATLQQLQQRQQAELEAVRAEGASARTFRASKQLLNQRVIERNLARAGKHDEAMAMKAIADRMEELEVGTHAASQEGNLGIREAKLAEKHQLEREALQQRGQRVRAELELRRRREMERRERRVKNVRQELASLQKLERVQLEAFLEQQVIAGKRAAPPPRPPPLGESQSTMSVRNAGLIGAHRGRPDATQTAADVYGIGGKLKAERSAGGIASLSTQWT